jgi:hypothetical protein
VAVAGETEIVWAVSPVDQRYAEKPVPASRVALPPVQTAVGPLIATLGSGLMVTVVVAGEELTVPDVATTA